MLVPREGTTPVGNDRTVALAPEGQVGESFALSADDVPTGANSFSASVTEVPWVLDVSGFEVSAPDDLLDMVLLVHFAL